MFFLCSGKQSVLRQVKPVSCVSRQTDRGAWGSPEHSDTAAPGITWGGGAWEEEPGSPGGQDRGRAARGAI